MLLCTTDSSLVISIFEKKSEILLPQCCVIFFPCGIEYGYLKKYCIKVRSSSFVTTLLSTVPCFQTAFLMTNVAQKTKERHTCLLPMWKSLTPAVVLGLLNRLTCWWTAPGPFVAPQWRTHQKGPHLSGMATVSSGLCPAEMVLQSAGVRGQHRWWQQSKSWNPKSTLAVLSSQSCRHFYIYT